MTSSPQRLLAPLSRSSDAFTRAIVAQALAYVRKDNPDKIAERAWPGQRAVLDYLERAVSTTASTTGTTWGEQLAGTSVADFLLNVGAPTAGASLLKKG